MGVSQRGNWKNWLLFMLRAIENTSNITFHKINKIVSMIDSILEFAKKDNRKTGIKWLVTRVFPYNKIQTKNVNPKILFDKNHYF